MNQQDIEHIFRFQLAPAIPEEKETNLYYMLIEDGSKIINRYDSTQGLEALVLVLDNFVLDAYRDKMPIFIKPSVE
jgi:hypothetical protein